MQKTIRRGFTQQHFSGHYVYLLKSVDFDEYYIGSTNDLIRRIEEHNGGKVSHTKKFMPWVLKYYEAYCSEELARARESALKKHGNAVRGLKMRAGVMGANLQKKKNAAGFTLVELVVVMGIIAVISTWGVAALLNVRNEGLVDRATEETISAIREAQNKAISISSTSGGVIPVAWGLYVDGNTSSIKPFYVTYAASTGTIVYPAGESIKYTGLSISTGMSIETPTSRYYFFTTPFGEYYTNSLVPASWSLNTSRPFDAIPAGSAPTEASRITITYKNSSSTVIVATNGDVYEE